MGDSLTRCSTLFKIAIWATQDFRSPQTAALWGLAVPGFLASFSSGQCRRRIGAGGYVPGSPNEKRDRAVADGAPRHAVRFIYASVRDYDVTEEVLQDASVVICEKQREFRVGNELRGVGA